MRYQETQSLQRLITNPSFPGLVIRRLVFKKIAYDAGKGDIRAIWCMAEALCNESDPTIRALSEKALSALPNQGAINAVCECVLEYGGEDLCRAVIKSGYRHSDEGIRALVSFICCRMEGRPPGDGIYDATMFRRGFSKAGTHTRSRILSDADQEAWTGWVIRALIGEHGIREPVLMTRDEWLFLVESLCRHQKYNDLWRLVFIAPLHITIEIFHRMSAANWVPGGDDQALFRELVALVPKSWQYTPVVGKSIDKDITGRRGMSCMVCSNDGTLFIIGGYDGSIGIFRLPQGNQVGSVQVQTASVTALALTPDGHTLASGDSDGKIRFMHVPDSHAAPITCEGHTGPITCLLFTWDGTSLISGGEDGVIRIWSTDTARSVATATGHTGPITCITLGLDSIYSGSMDCTIRSWDLISGKAGQSVHDLPNPAMSLAVSMDCNTLVSAAGKGPFRCYSLPDMKLIRTAGEQLKAGTCTALAGTTWGIRGHEDGRFEACSLDGTARFLTGGPYRPGLRSLVVSPDGCILATGGGDGTIRCWNIADATLLLTMKGHRSFVRTLSFTRAGKLLISIGWDESVRVWSMPGGEPVSSIRYRARKAGVCAASTGGGLVAIGDSDGKIRYYTLPDALETRTMEGYTPAITALALNPDGSILACAGSDRSLRVWRTGETDMICSLDGHAGAIHTLVFSPDGSMLAGGGWDDQVHIWDVHKRVHSHTLVGHSSAITALAWTSDGSILVSAGNDGTIRFWNFRDPRPIQTLFHGSVVITCIALSPDGTLLASGDRKGRVVIWRLADGSQEWSLEAHAGQVSAIGFSPDCTFLATGGADGICCLWSVPDGMPAGRQGGSPGRITGIVFHYARRLIFYFNEDGAVHRFRYPFTGPVSSALPGDIPLQVKPDTRENPDMQAREEYFRLLLSGTFRYDIGFADPSFLQEDFDIEIVEPFDLMLSEENKTENGSSRKERFQFPGSSRTGLSCQNTMDHSFKDLPGEMVSTNPQVWHSGQKRITTGHSDGINSHRSARISREV